MVASIPPEHLEHTCDTGKSDPDLRTFKWLIEDYPAHAQHPLYQITGTAKS